MCSKCNAVSEKIKIGYPTQLYSLIRQIKPLLVEGILVIQKSNCNIDDIQENKPWPNDVINHCFKCSHCKRTFTLDVETYHGSGGYWDYSD